MVGNNYVGNLIVLYTTIITLNKFLYCSDYTFIFLYCKAKRPFNIVIPLLLLVINIQGSIALAFYAVFNLNSIPVSCKFNFNDQNMKFLIN